MLALRRDVDTQRCELKESSELLTKVQSLRFVHRLLFHAALALPGCGERELNLDVAACAVWRGLLSRAPVQFFILDPWKDPWKQHRVNLLAASDFDIFQVIGLIDLTWPPREGLQSKHSDPQVLPWYRLSSDHVAWKQHPPLRPDGRAIGINGRECLKSETQLHFPQQELCCGQCPSLCLLLQTCVRKDSGKIPPVLDWLSVLV